MVKSRRSPIRLPRKKGRAVKEAYSLGRLALNWNLNEGHCLSPARHQAAALSSRPNLVQSLFLGERDGVWLSRPLTVAARCGVHHRTRTWRQERDVVADVAAAGRPGCVRPVGGPCSPSGRAAALTRHRYLGDDGSVAVADAATQKVTRALTDGTRMRGHIRHQWSPPSRAQPTRPTRRLNGRATDGSLEIDVVLVRVGPSPMLIAPMPPVRARPAPIAAAAATAAAAAAAAARPTWPPHTWPDSPVSTSTRFHATRRMKNDPHDWKLGKTDGRTFCTCTWWRAPLSLVSTGKYGSRLVIRPFITDHGWAFFFKQGLGSPESNPGYPFRTSFSVVASQFIWFITRLAISIERVTALNSLSFQDEL